MTFGLVLNNSFRQVNTIYKLSKLYFDELVLPVFFELSIVIDVICALA